MNMLGSYLGRDVCILNEVDFDAELLRSMLASAVVMLWLGDLESSSKYARVVREIVRESPLAILVGGPSAKERFEELIDWLSANNPSNHVMTKEGGAKVQECVSEFFEATWPAENRFASWHMYVVVIVGSEEGPIRRALLERLGKSDGAGL
jgi:hypothetical protein